MWKVFMNSPKINKTLVNLVLGGLSPDQFSKNPGYGLESVVEDFPPAQIREAQLNLAEEVLRQL